jgi:predicted HTH domain antitoxin
MDDHNETRFAREVPEAVRVEWAKEALRTGEVSTKKAAARIAEMPESTFKHRLLGRRTREEYGKGRQVSSLGASLRAIT